MQGGHRRQWLATRGWLLIYSRQVIWALVVLNVVVAGSFAYKSSDHKTQSVALATAELSEESELVLLSELAPVEQNAQSKLPDSKAEADEVRSCRVWGPRNSAGDFYDLAQALKEVGGFPEVVAVEVEAAPTFMVYVDGQSKARQIMQELKAIKVDNYRIQREEGDIISVGVFSRRPLAQRQLSRVRDLGYQADIEVMERSQTVFNLQAYVEPTSALYAKSSHDCPSSRVAQVSRRSP